MPGCVTCGAMVIRHFKTMWGAVGSGAPHATFATAIPAIAGEGWDGVVFALIALDFDPGTGSLPELSERCDEQGLDLALMIMTDGPDVNAHIGSFREQIERVAPLDPHYVIAHDGLDRFEPEEASAYYRAAVELEAGLPFPVAHETHRSRILFTPWATSRVLDEFPDLRLAIDLSHWMVVAERPLDDEMEIIRKAAERMIHLDARVGHEEGPQVPDPAAPEWEGHVASFEGWWDVAIEAARRVEPEREVVIVPEYGPPPYQQTLPYAAMPTTDLWQMSRAARDRLRARFGPTG